MRRRSRRKRSERNEKRKKEEINMATQIAPTPVVRGSQAKKILQQALKKPTIKSESGAQKLISFFEKK